MSYCAVFKVVAIHAEGILVLRLPRHARKSPSRIFRLQALRALAYLIVKTFLTPQGGAWLRSIKNSCLQASAGHQNNDAGQLRNRLTFAPGTTPISKNFYTYLGTGYSTDMRHDLAPLSLTPCPSSPSTFLPMHPPTRSTDSHPALRPHATLLHHKMSPRQLHKPL